jgi:alpha/beta superfamily hydrolase
MSQLERVDTPAGPIDVRCWAPPSGPVQELVVVTVHPWATLGGSEYNTVGIAKELSAKGVRTLTFNLRASSAVWGVISNHRSEVAQVEAICTWASQRWGHEIILFGSSAGAPIAGTVLPKVEVVTRYIGVGYTWGWFAAIAFGRHFGSILASEKVKRRHHCSLWHSCCSSHRRPPPLLPEPPLR